MEAYNYSFTAIRGVQAGREYYVAMCPLKLVPRIFRFNEEEIPAELRAQRTLNKSRIPEITRYLVHNPDDYVFSSITACIDADVKFEPLTTEGYGRNAGVLTVPMSSTVLINDGQHRRAAIEEALKENPDLGNETISVVFFIDSGLERSQQLFADLNKHAIRPTRSIGILYDHRDPFADLCRKLVKKVPIFKGLTEMEKTSISNRSTKLFTLSAIYQANQALLNKKKADEITDEEFAQAKEYWTALGEIIPEWRLAIQKEIRSSELRKEYVHVYGVLLQALGHVGYALLKSEPYQWREKLVPLRDVNWLRTNSVWEGRAMQLGSMTTAGDSVRLTANILKEKLGLHLTAEDMAVEDKLKKSLAQR
ncbi:MAG: DNA sulfur modification protein DndB [Chloroflexota bacterium]